MAKTELQLLYEEANRKFTPIQEVLELWIVMVCEYEC